MAVPKPWLTDKQKQDRLEWAREHEDWDLIDWSRVIWTDEAAIHNGIQRQMFVTRRPGEEYLPNCLRPKFVKPHFTMIWGSIIHGQQGPMVLWEKENWGNITSAGFLEHIFPVSIKQLFFFLIIILNYEEFT